MQALRIQITILHTELQVSTILVPKNSPNHGKVWCNPRRMKQQKMKSKVDIIHFVDDRISRWIREALNQFLQFVNDERTKQIIKKGMQFYISRLSSVGT